MSEEAHRDLVAKAQFREREARACFLNHDKDRSNTINAAELGEVLSALGLRHAESSDEEFDALVDATLELHDADRDGVLQFEEFVPLYNSLVQATHLACVFCAADVVWRDDILSSDHRIYGKQAFYVNKGVDGAIGGSYSYPMQLGQGKLTCSKATCMNCTASLGISFLAAAEGETNDVSEWFGKHCLSSAGVKKFPPGLRKGTWDMFCNGCRAPITSSEFILQDNHNLWDEDNRSAGCTPANYMSGVLYGTTCEGSIVVANYVQGPMGSCPVRCVKCAAYLGLRFKSDEGDEGKNAMQVGNYVLLKSKVSPGPPVERVFTEELEDTEAMPVTSHAKTPEDPGGLVGFLSAVGVSDEATLSRGTAWMEEMGADTLDEVVEAEMIDQLIDALELKPIKRKLLEKRIAEGDAWEADGGGGGGSGGGSDKIATKFFVSYTQRDPRAMLLASELWSEFRILGKKCWLDVKEPRRDMVRNRVVSPIRFKGILRGPSSTR